MEERKYMSLNDRLERQFDRLTTVRTQFIAMLCIFAALYLLDQVLKAGWF